jgi:carbonic anhydrase/acetyltransferase-like protein (isoleucine patch superfamily)
MATASHLAMLQGSAIGAGKKIPDSSLVLGTPIKVVSTAPTRQEAKKERRDELSSPPP